MPGMGSGNVSNAKMYKHTKAKGEGDTSVFERTPQKPEYSIITHIFRELSFKVVYAL